MGSASVKISSLLKAERVHLNLKAAGRDSVLKELVGRTGLEEKEQKILLVSLKQREELGSTGIGKSVAIPHCRSLLLNSLTLIVGRSKAGVDFDAIDKKPTKLFFLIIAPPHDPQNQYLITLGRIAQLAKELLPGDALFTADQPAEFISRITELEKNI
ncbi:MAG: PTS sugar transporter subunit IIA [Candidatus Edwardsbacteria bacterium]|nr:PTS sugar transporter subunit IIA [Candidatus Edwardsbacteria bacterium]MBU1576332.1 PTS sugar transporter subunit IIA [Candidatus Edwardsbacteria bacterium]MBU2462885.1 PTS sugar transporter subunit IIA [Candidatus Edwardsbacteria bacterium]MBU2593944.1 PTS sugar transporter subunit IIA [Candidatus Edwardsbacteria bacterium]